MTGLIAQQQCVGPLHTPLADVAVVALSPFSLQGAATAIGEQPIKGLISPAAGARMAVGEALTNLVFAQITALKVNNLGLVMPIHALSPPWKIKTKLLNYKLTDVCLMTCLFSFRM